MRNPKLLGKFGSPVVIKKTPNYAFFLWVNVVSMGVGDLNLILTTQCGNYHLLFHLCGSRITKRQKLTDLIGLLLARRKV